MKKILVIYYSQTGQLKNIADSVLSPILKDEDFQVDYQQIKPVNDYQFPWTDDGFYDAMPESVKGIPCPIEDISIDNNSNYDLVILAYQVWFLSPSIPFWSFLQNKKNQDFLKNKNVITILGVRNMWVNAHKRIQQQFKELNINHIGNIVLADKNSNLVGVLLVIKYLLTGNDKPYKLLPKYGVRETDIKKAEIFGDFIKTALINNDFSQLQTKIAENNGVFLKFSLRTTELAAGKIFLKWANFVLKKGEAKDPNRRYRTKLFKTYLMILIFVISPISSTIFRIINILFYPFVKKSLYKTALMK
ncbi:MAG: hypothetical protein ABFS35_05755 [Bacteroidota bacterium]